MEFDYALLAKYLIGSLSPEEMEVVMRWRDLSAANRYRIGKRECPDYPRNALPNCPFFVEICRYYLAVCLVFNCRMELF